MNKLTRSLTTVALLFLCQGHATAADSAPALPAQDCLKVVCTTPSTNALGSMPLGNGDIRLMVWAETNGDLLLYLGKCDSWDENGRLLKLGRVRLRFSQQPFAKSKPFRQALHADRGEIEIVAGEPGRELQAPRAAANHRRVRISSGQSPIPDSHARIAAEAR
jgi:hypothetical protein